MAEWLMRDVSSVSCTHCMVEILNNGESISRIDLTITNSSAAYSAIAHIQKYYSTCYCDTIRPYEDLGR
jgi:hypothetical protein